MEADRVRVRSSWWYLLPIFFSVVGGVIAYFILRDDDPRKAKNCLWLGIILTAISTVLTVISFAIFGFAESGFTPRYQFT
ncbi:MAG: hypothetical protein ACE5J2_08005 [Nitrososphaerales archaeon]